MTIYRLPDGTRLEHGDRIAWNHYHPFDSSHGFPVWKYGRFVSLIKHTMRHSGVQLAWVHFDGNKRHSRVPFNELRKTKL